MEALLGILILFAFFRALWNRKKGKTKRKKAYNTKTSKIKKRERKEKLKEQERLREIREEENFFKAVEKERKEIVRKEQALQREKLRESTPIVFPDIIKPVLEILIKDKPLDKPIFGMTAITFCRHFKKFIVQYCLDLNLTPYSARRTTATALALAEVPPAVIAKIMRQTSYDTTLKYYTKIDYADALDALNKLK